jgi:glutathione S-transferase
MKHYLETDPVKKEVMGKRLKEVVMAPFLEKLSKILKENGNGVLVGKELTYADLYVAHFLSESKQPVEDYPDVLKHREIVYNNPNIKAYIASRPVTPK